MSKLSKRAWFAISLGLLAVPLVATAIAYGCTAVATLSADPGAAAAGSTITVSGQGFGTHDPALANSNGPAEIRLGSVTGPVLATASPTGTKRTFSVQVTVPQAAAGDTFITATQTTASGTPVYGTPARQAFTVTAPETRSAGTSTSSGLTASGPNPVAPSNSTGTAAGTKKTTASIAKAVAACKRTYNPSKAKSKNAKKRAAAKRAACIKKAKA
jgi:hypothetical protein